MSKENTTKVSFPIFGILGIIFIVLKVMGIGLVATWSWWLVLLPFYGPILFAIAFMLIVLFFAFMVALLES